METNLLIIFAEGKIFVGKRKEYVKDLLEDCIECIPMMTPDGRYMIIGNLIGTLTVPKDCVVATISKESMYYKNYFQTTSQVEIIKPQPNFGSGRKIN